MLWLSKPERIAESASRCSLIVYVMLGGGATVLLCKHNNLIGLERLGCPGMEQPALTLFDFSQACILAGRFQGHGAH